LGTSKQLLTLSKKDIGMKRFFTAIAVTMIAFLSCKKDKTETQKTAPVVTTAALSNVNIAAGTATGGGSIVSDGGATITQSGLVMSKTNATPTKADSVMAGTTATGTFTTNLTGLDFGKTYYFRAFATNSVGTGYGDVVTLTTSADSVKFTYNGQSVTYGIITSPASGKKWLDRNLGAKQVATSSTDYLAYGDLFQWGRPADGHQVMNWTSSGTGVATVMTNVLATSDNPGHSNWIDATASDTWDWRSDNNMNRWATNPQGPCPAGWHVPSLAEWGAETSTTVQEGTATSGGIMNAITAYTQLKLTAAGFRRSPSSTVGQLGLTGTDGYYWSTSLDIQSWGAWARIYNYGTDYCQLNHLVNSTGACIRCIKD
jgi:uncharacterized protein (TIGR02145 family)